MTQRIDSNHPPLKRSLLIQSLSWISVLSLLSPNLVLAQTQPAPDVVFIPNSQTSSPKSAPPANQNAAYTGRLQRLKQKLSTTRTTSIPRSSRQTSTQFRPRKTTPINGTYIDPTNYSIGATRSYDAPSSVVFSERSTGCKTALQPGQRLSGSLCGTPRVGKTRIASQGNRSQLTRPNLAVPQVSRSRLAARTSMGFPTRNAFSASGLATPLTNKTLPTGKSVFYYKRTPQAIAKLGNINLDLMFPLTVPAQITSLFGWRIHPITGNRRFHSGTDLGAALGTPVLAADDGNVAIADFLGGYGLTVVLEHNKFTQQTLYAHLSQIFVQPGEWVEQGTVIGRVGSTGNSTGPHLHFETRHLTPEGWVATDPSLELEYALAQLVAALRTAQTPQPPLNKG